MELIGIVKRDLSSTQKTMLVILLQALIEFEQNDEGKQIAMQCIFTFLVKHLDLRIICNFIDSLGTVSLQEIGEMQFVLRRQDSSEQSSEADSLTTFTASSLSDDAVIDRDVFLESEETTDN